MHLTDEQWCLIEPILPEPSPFARGRPPFDPRLVMDGILCKIRLAIPWYDLPFHDRAQPPAPGEQPRPSWQTCYRAYTLWKRQGLMEQVYRLLYQDLRDRGGIDLLQTLQFGGIVPPGIDPACRQGTIPLTFGASGWHLHLPAELEGTWQASTVHLLVQVILRHLKPPLRPRPSRTLIIEYHHPEQESAS